VDGRHTWARRLKIDSRVAVHEWLAAEGVSLGAGKIEGDN
jgi:hypothetical protein